MSLTILMNNVEVGNNAYYDSRKVIYNKFMQLAKLVTEKRVWNIIFVVVIYDYNKNIFLLWWDSTSSVYVAMGIWNLNIVYIVY